jgi:hypothetical protein
MNIKKTLVLSAFVGLMNMAAHAADLVVIGHPSAAAMTKDQVADLFLGKTTSATPVDQVETGAV